MPSRVIRDGFLASERVAALSAEAECFYHRLLLAVDDAGRIDGRKPILAASTFPLRPATDVGPMVEECEAAGLVIGYECRGKPFVQVTHWARAGSAKVSKCPWKDGRLVIEYATMGERLTAKGDVVAREWVRSSLLDAEEEGEGRGAEGVGTGSVGGPPTDTGTGTEASTGTGGGARTRAREDAPRVVGEDAGGNGGAAPNAPDQGDDPLESTHGGGRGGSDEVRGAGGTAPFVDVELAARLLGMLGEAQGRAFPEREAVFWAQKAVGPLRRQGVTAGKQLEMMRWCCAYAGETGVPSVSRPWDWVDKWGALVDARKRIGSGKLKEPKAREMEAAARSREAERLRRMAAEHERQIAELDALKERMGEDLEGFAVWLDGEGKTLQAETVRERGLSPMTMGEAVRFLDGAGAVGSAGDSEGREAA